MEPERNDLIKILKKLSSEYAMQGWSIEYIDLRWGVSKAESKSNNTMSICLGELKRCMELSPRPYFIFLCGDRYGWIPLPEKLLPDDMRRITEIATTAERGILNRFYSYDANELPNGQYVLTGIVSGLSMIDADVRSLMGLIKRAIPSLCISATAWEIEKGVFDVPGAKEHAIGYFRSLSDVPGDMKNIYFDTDPESVYMQRKLRNRLKDLVDSRNVFEAGTIPFQYYGEYLNKQIFAANMERIIRHKPLFQCIC